MSLVCGCAGADPVAGLEQQDGRGGSDDVGPILETNCGALDTLCPADRPFAGAPCADGLTCEYVEDAGKTNWVLTCEDGAWSAWADCELLPGGCQLIPPTAEACEPPFDGALDANVEIGPASEDAFRPFLDGEKVGIVWGAQGSSMLFYRVKLTGPELPTCVALDVELTSPAFIEAFPGHETVLLRCGQSLSIYTILPYGNCVDDETHFGATLDVHVQGVGGVKRDLQLPYEALCGFTAL